MPRRRQSWPSQEWLDQTRLEVTADVTGRQLNTTSPRFLTVGEDDGLRGRVQRVLDVEFPRHGIVVVHLHTMAGAIRSTQDFWLALIDAGCDNSGCISEIAALARTLEHTDLVVMCAVHQQQCIAHAHRAGLRYLLEASELPTLLPSIMRCNMAYRRHLPAALIHSEMAGRISYRYGPDVARRLGHYAPPAPEPERLDDLQLRAVQDALVHTRGNARAAAIRLGISHQALHRLLHKYDIGIPTAAEASSRIRAWPYAALPDGED